MNDMIKILKLAQAVSLKTGNALPTIGRKAIGNARIFERIEDGGECLPRTYRKLEAWLKQELKR